VKSLDFVENCLCLVFPENRTLILRLSSLLLLLAVRITAAPLAQVTGTIHRTGPCKDTKQFFVFISYCFSSCDVRTWRLCDFLRQFTFRWATNRRNFGYEIGTCYGPDTCPKIVDAMFSVTEPQHIKRRRLSMTSHATKLKGIVPVPTLRVLHGNETTLRTWVQWREQKGVVASPHWTLEYIIFTPPGHSETLLHGYWDYKIIRLFPAGLVVSRFLYSTISGMPCVYSMLLFGYFRHASSLFGAFIRVFPTRLVFVRCLYSSISDMPRVYSMHLFGYFWHSSSLYGAFIRIFPYKTRVCSVPLFVYFWHASCLFDACNRLFPTGLVFIGCLSTVSHKKFFPHLVRTKTGSTQATGYLKIFKAQWSLYESSAATLKHLRWLLTKCIYVFHTIFKTHTMYEQETCCSDELTAQTVPSLETTRTNKSGDVEGHTKLGTETQRRAGGVTERALALRFPKRQLSCDCAVDIEK
jgi:hypothetical protein